MHCSSTVLGQLNYLCCILDFDEGAVKKDGAVLLESCDLYPGDETLDEVAVESHETCEAGLHMLSIGPMKGGGI